jgi:aminoglycoside phosphotransferase (APT) family kinase protein
MISRLAHTGALPPELPDLTAEDSRVRLMAYVREHWMAGAEFVGLRRAEGGFSNETWLLDLKDDGRQQTFVLRRQALVGPLEPYDLAREAAIIRALRSSEVPVPEICLLCEQHEVAGSPFMIMERVEGAAPDYRSLPEYPPWATRRNRTAMAREMFGILARIQAADPSTGALGEALGDADGPGGPPPVIRRVRWILQKLDLQLGSHAVLPILRDVAGWLIEHVPDQQEGSVLVHGDFKVGNFIWQGNSIVAVLDWELSTRGSPLEDVGYACHPVMRSRAPNLMAMLVPLEELAAIYEVEMGRPLDLPRLHYYVIYASYFHLYTLLSGFVSALNGADLRVALGYSKFHQVTRELLDHIAAFERGSHVL